MDINITYTYDSTSVTNGKGKLTGRTDSSGAYTFYHDAQGNVNREDKTVSGVLYTTQYVYNKNNTLTSITYPTGRAITYTLDQTGKITQVDTTLNGNLKTLASSISYLPYGGITGLTYGNSLSLSHGYDNQYRTSSIIVGSILSRTYDYDPNGNITSILDAIEPSGNETFENAGTYTYDTGTNILADIQGEANVVYDYDDNGNTISVNSRTFVYDLSNRLITVQDNGVTIAQYVYNALNQRTKKILPSETRIFHYDLQGHLIAETSPTGAMLAEHVYLGEHLLAMVRPGETAYYYHNDHLGTPQLLTNDTGTTSWKAFYKPFGEVVISVSTVENPFRFPGQYYDQETGLHYNWNRYYDPKNGRYLTPDPIGLGGGLNLYLYVGSNPIITYDGLGLFDDGINAGGRKWHGHSDFSGGWGPNRTCDYTLEDRGKTAPDTVEGNPRHFRTQDAVESDLKKDIKKCDQENFCRHMHQGQDSFTHRGKGWRTIHPPWPFNPDHDEEAWARAEEWTKGWLEQWKKRCMCK